MKMWLFWTRGSGIVDWLICRVTGGDWSHVGIRFDDQYFEAHGFGKDKGFRGPKPLSKLVAWAREPGNAVEFLAVPMMPDDIMACLAWCEAEANRARRGYDLVQLLRIYAVRRLSWLGLTVASDPSRVCCHEAVIRCLRTVGIDLTDEQYPTADASDPGHVNRAFRRWLEAQI